MFQSVKPTYLLTNYTPILVISSFWWPWLVLLWCQKLPYFPVSCASVLVLHICALVFIQNFLSVEESALYENGLQLINSRNAR
jgi:hypothetical protein